MPSSNTKKPKDLYLSTGIAELDKLAEIELVSTADRNANAKL